MKKILPFLFIFIAIIIIWISKAERINSIKMDVYIDSFGDAHITEVWDAKPTGKTEYYHAFYNIGESSIENFKVKDETREYSYIDWDVYASLEKKAYHYGFNYDYNGVELCFGKSSYKRHKYILTYTIKNFVYNTTDGKQVIYWTMLNKINPAPKNVLIKIHSDFKYSYNIPIFGYGNNGSAFVADKNQTKKFGKKISDGQIVLYNNHLKNTDYMTVLAVFDANTFTTEKLFDYSIDEIKNMAHNDEINYANNIKKNKMKRLSYLYDLTLLILILMLPIVLILLLLKIIDKSSKNIVYGGTKKIVFDEASRSFDKDIPMFRDLPCGSDIKRAYWIAIQYGFFKRKTDFLGAILLKWIKEEKVNILNETEGIIFKKEDTKIVFKQPSISNSDTNEYTLYKFLYEASHDGILESREFENWCKINYDKILHWFDDVLDSETNELVKENKLIYKKASNIFIHDEYIVDSSMKEDAIKMAGLKKFFEEFDSMSDKRAIDVHLWREYLIYAQIFGVAAKVVQEFKRLYPEEITDYDYNSFTYINSVSYDGISSALNDYSTAKSNSSGGTSYSSDGGGFSSGGGGGSFGGGGGSFGGGSR